MSTRTPMSRVSKPLSARPAFSGSNPFDSDSESELLDTRPGRASSAPPVNKNNFKSQQLSYDEDQRRGTSSYSHVGVSATRSSYRNDFRDSGGLENQSVQELENYAVYKAEETTQKVNGCLKIAEEMREGAAKTLVILNQQGEQINKTHHTAANIEYDLSRGEKLLGSLGGIFSRTWKPKKTRQIKGPLLTRDDSFIKTGSHMEQRQRLGLSSPTKARPNAWQISSEPANALEKVEVEKAKQDDTLSDLSNILGQLKEMAVDMGSEIERQNKALGHLDDDVDEVVFRVKGANQRARRLLGR